MAVGRSELMSLQLRVMPKKKELPHHHSIQNPTGKNCLAEVASCASLINQSLVQGLVIYYEGLNLSFLLSDGPGIGVSS